MQALRQMRQDASGDAKPDAPQATLQKALEEARQPQEPAGAVAAAQAPAGGRRTVRPPIKASRTETACGVLGWLCIALGFLGPVAFLGVAVRMQDFTAGWLVGVIFALSLPGGIVGGVFWFAVQKALRYLRMSVNSTNRLRS